MGLNMNTNISTATLNKDAAMALAFLAIKEGKNFTCAPMESGDFSVTADEELLELAGKKTYAYIVEGGSSGEFSVHTSSTAKDAEIGRKRSSKHSYRSGAVIELSAVVSALGEMFFEPAENLVQSSFQLEYA